MNGISIQNHFHIRWIHFLIVATRWNSMHWIISIFNVFALLLCHWNQYVGQVHNLETVEWLCFPGYSFYSALFAFFFDFVRLFFWRMQNSNAIMNICRMSKMSLGEQMRMHRQKIFVLKCRNVLSFSDISCIFFWGVSVLFFLFKKVKSE